ncbi:MAG: lytic transglycosylase domain-containing protein, partial [Rhodospirillales bacterium]
MGSLAARVALADDGAATAASGIHVAVLDTAEPRDSIDMPRVLSDADIERYAAIFSIQESGNWKAADRLIAKLGDKILLGHVLAQRYLHPTKYRTKYTELKAW